MAATGTCPRCGRFICTACERRTRPDATPMCPGCWELRAKVVAPVAAQSKTRLHTIGFWLGIASFLPICPVMIASVVVNIIALTRTNDEETQKVKWKPIVGLCCTGGAVLLWVLVAAAAIAFGK